jgi:hypothetical protein
MSEKGERSVSLQDILPYIFGAGFVGFVTVLVASYRRLKAGKINDDESIILRLHRELARQEARADEAEAEREIAVMGKQEWREQAWTYRLQLLEAGVQPKELPRPSEIGTRDDRAGLAAGG